MAHKRKQTKEKYYFYVCKHCSAGITSNYYLKKKDSTCDNCGTQLKLVVAGPSERVTSERMKKGFRNSYA